MSEHLRLHFISGPDGGPIATPVGGCKECGEQGERDHAIADMAHRDDLARDVAREWAGIVDAGLRDEVLPREVAPDLTAALDRLAAEYRETP